MNLIILFEKDRLEGDRFKLSDTRAEHIINILKLVENDMLEIGLLNGWIGKGRVESVKDNNVIISTVEKYKPEYIQPEIDLICALPRPQTLKKVLFICGMMAVRNLYLIRANRVEKSFYHSPLLEKENLEAHLIDGMMQGKVTRLPNVEIYDRFKNFFEDTLPSKINKETMKIIPDMECDTTLSKIYYNDIKEIIIAIGPEGGWVPYEVELIESLGFKKISLGRRILRVEHAVMSCLSQIEMLEKDRD